MKISLSTHCEATQRASSIHDKSHFLSLRRSLRTQHRRPLQLQISCRTFRPPLLSIPSAFFLEYFHGNEPLVCFIKTSLRNVFTGSRLFASQILQSRPPARSALRNHVVLYIFFFLSHLSDFQPLAQYSPPSATKRAEHTESSLIRAFSPSLRLPPSGNRFARGLAEGRLQLQHG